MNRLTTANADLAIFVHFTQHKDVLIGFNFAPLVFQNKSTGMLEVDLVSPEFIFRYTTFIEFSKRSWNGYFY